MRRWALLSGWNRSTLTRWNSDRLLAARGGGATAFQEVRPVAHLARLRWKNALDYLQ